MTTIFTVQEVPAIGGWQVFGLGRTVPFGTDRLGALDYAAHQNARYARAAEFAAPR